MDGNAKASSSEDKSAENLNTDSEVHRLPLLVEDYVFHGEELEDYSIYELACLTSAKGTTVFERDKYMNACKLSPSTECSCWNRRVLFQPGHSKSQTRWISFL